MTTTVEAWARAYVLADTFEAKLAPPPPPGSFAPRWSPEPALRPGRGPEFAPSDRGVKSTGSSLLRGEARRAKLIHAFLHHELQAAELFAWALVAFPEAPRAMRLGFVRILREEVRHMGLYREWLERRGMRPGTFAVRDWFWERVPAARTPTEFVATLGMGFEGGNLDHAARFTERFRAAGDLEAAKIQEVVGAEEVGHVRFALHWFRELRGGAPSTFEAFRSALPSPLTPTLMRGEPLDRERRGRAGFDDAFLAELERWSLGA
jgi:uncharacterized ferritin-like protein (DUF455 family)